MCLLRDNYISRHAYILLDRQLSLSLKKKGWKGVGGEEDTNEGKKYIRDVLQTEKSSRAFLISRQL